MGFQVTHCHTAAHMLRMLQGSRCPGPRSALRPPSLRGCSRRQFQKWDHPKPTHRKVLHVSAWSGGSKERRAENVTGEFFVDKSCIDCDVCRWMCPSTFSRVNGMSAVHAQPSSPEERLKALQALVSCPTNSIRTETPPKDIAAAHDSFPLAVEHAPAVFHLGWHSERSYSAASYLIMRPAEGNVMVDCPRYNPVLRKKLEEFGGLKYIFLTHQDDVADHDRWAAHFGATRIMHRSDIRQGTREVEMQLDGSGPWRISQSADDLEIVHVPGHSLGSLCLLHKPSRTLFSGDHFAFDSDLGRLSGFPEYSYDYTMLLKSTKKLKGLPFVTVLPGHGRRVTFASVAQKDAQVQLMLDLESPAEV